MRLARRQPPDHGWIIIGRLGEGRPSPPAVSGTLSILFADLRDYTAFVEAHGDAAAAELIEQFRRIVRTAVSPYWRQAKADWYLGRLQAWAGERGLTFPAD